MGADLNAAVKFGIDYVQAAIAASHLPLKGRLHILP